MTFRSLFHGMAARACLILVTALCTQASAEGLSPAAQAHLSALQATARQQHLAGSAMWRALLHYRVQPLTRRDRSLADDPDFFLSSDGARDAQHELDATLAAFFDTRPSHALNQAASCRFMARYQWLDAQLHFEHPAMPEPVCERYRQWRSGINADTVTLIFPSAYLNSPASMYGHTFLRLDPKREPGQASSPLLAYAVNYAANGDENDGLAFAFRGLTGLYAGAFTNAPYYLRIRDYNDLENRDIWEYELNLSAPEIERLLAHTWELGPTRFDYYFFDENCSYHLLSLLDSARPELALSDRFTWWAIPLDTVRAVTDTPGLLRSMHYRAANSTELRLRASQLSPVEAGLAQQLSAGTLKPEALAAQVPSAPQRALILETAERLTAFNATRGDSTEEIAQRQRMALLGARAALPSTAPLVVPTPEADPTQGHDTARVDVMLGQRNGHGAVRLQARPAYHDLLDPERGYQRGAAIQFFSVELGKDTNKRVQLERFTPVEISSLSPREPLLSAKSWRVHIGLERSAQARPDGQRPLGVNLNGGPGLAVELNAQQTLMAYALLDNQARWDRSLTHRPWAFGSGVATGVLADLSAQWRVQAEVFGRAYLAGQPAELGASVQMRYSLGKAWNAAGQCALSQRHGQHVSQSCMVGFQHYN